MSDLLSLLSLGSAGIAAHNAGVSIATNNVANVNTRGYSRQRVDLESLLGAPLVGGVRSGDPQRMADNLLAARIHTAAGSLAMSEAFADALSDLEDRLASGTTVDQQLAGVFGKLSAASAAPTDSISRDAVVAAVRDLVSGIHRRAGELAAARAEVNQRIGDSVEEASSVAKRLAETNLAIARGGDPVMADERDRLATRLAELTGGKPRIDGDGQMRFVLDGGAVLVDGGRAATLAAAPDPTTGDLAVSVVDGAVKRDVTTAIGGGTLGAQLRFRDGSLASARGDLDQLASDVATQFNTVHAANAGKDGVTGRPMFVAPTQVAGAAAALAIDPALDADSSKLALAAPGSGPGDNRGALALVGLATQPVATGGKTLGTAALDIIGHLASATSDAKASVTRDGLVSEHLAGLRDSLAGVDTQEELTNLARFEHASTALTKFVSTIDGMLGSLIDQL